MPASAIHMSVANIINKKLEKSSYNDLYRPQIWLIYNLSTTIFNVSRGCQRDI